MTIIPFPDRLSDRAKYDWALAEQQSDWLPCDVEAVTVTASTLDIEPDPLSPSQRGALIAFFGAYLFALGFIAGRLV